MINSGPSSLDGTIDIQEVEKQQPSVFLMQGVKKDVLKRPSQNNVLVNKVLPSSAGSAISKAVENLNIKMEVSEAAELVKIKHNNSPAPSITCGSDFRRIEQLIEQQEESNTEEQTSTRKTTVMHRHSRPTLPRAQDKMGQSR